MSFASSRRTYDTDSIVLRRIFAYDLSNSPFSTGFILTSLTKGVATFLSPNVALSTIGLSNLPAQISTLEAQLVSTAAAFYPSLPSSAEVFLPSTVTGLGTSGYISTSILQSTIEGLGTYGYLSSSVFGDVLTSSIEGLGTYGYISSASLYSTVEGLGSVGYLSSTQLTSSLDAALPSTVEGLGTYGYISSLSFYSTFNSAFPSTIEGLGTYGYISTQSLQSTVVSLPTFGFVSSMFSSFRSSFSNSFVGNWCNTGFLYSNMGPLSTVQTFNFDMGNALRTQMNTSTTNLDIEFKANLQFGYYDSRSIQYDFSTCLVRGVSLNTSTIISQENISYYILNASAVNLPFFFTEKYRFLVNDANTISTLKSDERFSTLSLFHRVGISSPTTNQLFVFPAKPTSITMVLDNSTRTF